MNKFLLIVLIVQAALAQDLNIFHSQKLAREFSTPTKSEITYEKNNDWLSSVRAGPRSGRADQFYEGTFSTRVDHFRPLNQQRVDFTYNVNANHFEEGGPLYIYLKDTFDYSTQWIERGLMVDVARETGAAVMTFDYRYFGRNRLFENASFENLELLSVEQILGDLAEFIRFVRHYVGGGHYSTVILFGSGFGGSAAVYGRSRYPHLVHAAWSSSGILESSVYSWGPYDILEYTFNLNDNGHCRDLIRNAYDVVAYLVLSGEGEYLGERLNLCNPVNTTSTADVAALYENTLRAVFYYLQQHHYNGVQQFCRDMDAIPGDSLNSFARWLRYVYGDSQCFDPSYETLINLKSNPEWDQEGTTSGRRQWYFLQCTQVGSFLVADQYTWLAGTVDIWYHLEKCEDLFGVPFSYGTITDAFYALRDEYDQALQNVIYTNGNLDPLRYFGRTYDSTYAGIVLNIEFASKSADLHSISVNDPGSIYQAKEVIIEHLTRWSNTTERSN